MFTKRQQQVLQAILGYAAANVGDINDAFAVEADQYPDQVGRLVVNGDIVDAITDEEIEQLRNLFQG